jgi:hypothetical protein
LAEVDAIRTCIDAFSTETCDALPWDQLESALIINYTDKNKGDLHYDIRHDKGFNVGSHKTHIDVTSGGDVQNGLSPATDFFIVTASEIRIPVLVHTANVKILSGAPTPNSGWYTQTIKVKKLAPRNNKKNPSIQLLEKTDIEELRLHQTIGHCLIFLKNTSGEIFAVNAKSTNDLNRIMGEKTKRMFRFAAPSYRPIIIPSVNEDSKGHKPSADTFLQKPRASNQGRTNNPALNSAIEQHGVALCEQYFSEQGFSVIDVSKPELAVNAGLTQFPGFDQLMRNGIESLNVEVKSTTTRGEQINISSNELAAAVSNDDWRLCIVKNIEIVNAKKLELKGGELELYKVADSNPLKSCIGKITEAIAMAEETGLIVSPSYSLRVIEAIFEKFHI